MRRGKNKKDFSQDELNEMEWDFFHLVQSKFCRKWHISTGRAIRLFWKKNYEDSPKKTVWKYCDSEVLNDIKETIEMTWLTEKEVKKFLDDWYWFTL